METLYCQCFCYLINSKAYTSFFVFTDNKLVIVEKGKGYEAKNEYEALIKITNRMLLELEEKYNKSLLDKKIILAIANEEVHTDLIAESKKIGLDTSVDGLYKYLFDFIKKYNVLLTLDINDYLLKDTSLNINFTHYFKLFELINKMYFEVRKSQLINKRYHKELSRYDMAIQDILHFIEFTDLNADKKIEFVDTIRKIRERRRKLKNEMEILTRFAHPLNKILGTVDRMTIKSNSNLSENEVFKYKQMFSTKVAREKLLKTL